MKKTRTVRMPKPCHKDWEAMTPVERGRHCASCNTIVYDFSRYSDEQLIELLKHKKEDMCGRFTNLQLNRPLVVSHNSFLQKALVGTAIMAGVAVTANAQTATTHDSVKSKATASLYQYSAKRRIAGTIAGWNSGKKLKNAIVYVKETKQMATTDFSGYFEIYLPDSVIGKKVTVYFKQYPNNAYEKNVKINTRKLPAKLDIKLDDSVIYHQTGRFL